MSPIVIPAIAPSGTLVYEWVDPNGVVRALSGNPSVNILTGERGLGAPGVDLSDDKLPFASGTLIRHAAIGARDIELPVLFGPVASASVLESLMDSVYSWFATADEQSRTPGFLRVTRHDGSQRQVACYYVGGLEGDMTSARSGDVWQRAEIRLRAADPWAADLSDTEYTWAAAALPNVTVMNSGQVDAYPIWRFHGPFGSIAATNTTTGRTWNLVVALTLDRELIVDTRPANQRDDLTTYVTDLHTNLYPYFTSTSDLWPLVPGSNSLTITLSGTPATGAETLVILDYLQRYRGLLR